MFGALGCLKTGFTFLQSPFGLVIVAVLIYGAGYYRGDQAADAKCAAEKAASIEAARQIDAKAQADADARMREQLTAARTREVAAKEEVERYAKIAESCVLRSGADDPAISVPDKPVSSSPPNPPRRR